MDESLRDMPDVMLFAAGLGTRMRPLTFDTPKALIDVAGKPLIDHVIDAAIAEGCTRFVANAHYKGERIAEHMERLAAALPGFSFASNSEKNLLDTGGGLRVALGALASDPILTLNADSFWLAGTDTPLARMRARFDQGDADIVLLCVSPDNASGFRKGADYLLADDGTLDQSEGRPVIFAGAALLARDIAAQGPEGAFSLYRHFEAARARGRLKGVMIATRWFHVGDPQALARAAQEIGALV